MFVRLPQSKEPAPLLHPKMAGYYRRQVKSLHEALNSGPEAERLKAADLLRSLISAIMLTPSDNGLEIDVQGDLAGILTIASNAKSHTVLQAGLSQLEMVAGIGFEPVKFRFSHSVINLATGSAFPKLAATKAGK